MENITITIIIFIVILIVIFVLIILYRTYFLPNTTDIETEKENELKYQNMYKIPSPWGYSKNSPSEEGICSLYTFTSLEPYTPAKINYNDLNNCVENGTCNRTSDNITCYDVDQIIAQQKIHTCRGLDNKDCLTQNGIYVSPGETEEYFTKCSSKKRCEGELSLIVFNLNTGVTGPKVFNNSMCMALTAGQFIQQKCDMSTQDNGVPTQLFRIERANYVNGKFIENTAGNFVRIVTRPDNLVLQPDIINNSFTLEKLTQNKGYYWVMVNEMEDPKVPNPQFTIASQFVYIPDPKEYLKNYSASETSLWNYLTKPNDPENRQYSIQIPSLKKGKPVILDKLVVYNSLENNSSINNTNYLNYSILPLLLYDVSLYTF